MFEYTANASTRTSTRPVPIMVRSMLGLRDMDLRIPSRAEPEISILGVATQAALLPRSGKITVTTIKYGL